MPLIKSYIPTKNIFKIQQLLSASDLTMRDRDDLMELFFKAEDNELKPVVKLFDKNPDWIKKISENYKAKRSAFANNNYNIWQNIFLEEENQLKELL